MNQFGFKYVGSVIGLLEPENCQHESANDILHTSNHFKNQCIQDKEDNNTIQFGWKTYTTIIGETGV